MMLGRHQLHPPVQRAAGVIGVGAYRRQQADTCGAQPRRADGVVLHQLGGDRLGAASRQIEIVGVGPLVVGMADDEDVE